MADFKSVIAKLEDSNGKTAMFINSIKKFEAKKGWDEITVRVESGLGVKVATGNAAIFTLIVDKDEFDRVCNEVDAELKGVV